jgi:hypothetical protein
MWSRIQMIVRWMCPGVRSAVRPAVMSTPLGPRQQLAETIQLHQGVVSEMSRGERLTSARARRTHIS